MKPWVEAYVRVVDSLRVELEETKAAHAKLHALAVYQAQQLQKTTAGIDHNYNAWVISQQQLAVQTNRCADLESMLLLQKKVKQQHEEHVRKKKAEAKARAAARKAEKAEAKARAEGKARAADAAATQAFLALYDYVGGDTPIAVATPVNKRRRRGMKPPFIVNV